MKLSIYCNRCDKCLTASKDVFWILFSSVYPNNLEELKPEEKPLIYPLCKDCFEGAKSFILPINNGE